MHKRLTSPTQVTHSLVQFYSIMCLASLLIQRTKLHLGRSPTSQQQANIFRL